MDNTMNNAKVIDNASIEPEVNKYGAISFLRGDDPCIMKIGDTTVHCSFNDSGDLNTRLANAFQTMLNS